MTSNDGFSVVAPVRVTAPSSTKGRITSCCALLKRWISSMKRMVRWPYIPRRSPASSTIWRRSATPAVTAGAGREGERGGRAGDAGGGLVVEQAGRRAAALSGGHVEQIIAWMG